MGAFNDVVGLAETAAVVWLGIKLLGKLGGGTGGLLPPLPSAGAIANGAVNTVLHAPVNAAGAIVNNAATSTSELLSGYDPAQNDAGQYGDINRMLGEHSEILDDMAQWQAGRVQGGLFGLFKGDPCDWTAFREYEVENQGYDPGSKAPREFLSAYGCGG